MNPDALAWPRERLPEAMEALCRAAALPVQAARLSPPLREPSRWIESAAVAMGVEAEPVDAPYADVPRALERCAPALVMLRDQALLVVARRGSRLRVLSPDLKISSLSLAALAAAMREPAEAEAGPQIEALLDRARLQGRRREQTRTALLGARVGGARVSGWWIFRARPGADPRWQAHSAGLQRGLVAVAALYAAQFGFWLLTWWLIGVAALQGRLEWGWLLAWGLLRLTIIPLRVAVSWASGSLAIDAGALLKVRLLAGALRLLPEETRSEGVGRLLGRTLESEAVEQLGTGGAFLALFGGIELVFSAVVLALGAAGPLHAVLLAGWCIACAVFARRYHALRDRWTEARLALTHDQVERIVGHRTRLAQEAAEHWHKEEDASLDRYFERARAMDAGWLPLAAAAPGGWLMLGVAGLVPAFIAGAEPGALAVGLLGAMLASFALQKIAASLPLLSGAVVSWGRVAPLFQAAARPQTSAPPQFEEAAAEGPLLESTDLVFRHQRRSEPVLRGCAIRVSRGDRVLLEGPTGSGKSTLGAILAGLREPSSGLLLLHGLDCKTLGESGWRKRIACAPQFHENHVLTAPFAFNLLMGRAWPPQQKDLDEAAAICRELDLGPLLERMPAGLGQMVGESGWQLSHGERSRLFIARALLQNAEMVVLDESFAALDPITLRRSLDCVLARAPAALVIAHP